MIAMFRPRRVAHAHCDLMCGVYDPAQARIEAESVKAIMQKYQESTDDVFRQRCVIIKEQRAEMVKHHLWVLWTDYFKPPHVEQFPQLHDLFWRATKKAGDAKKWGGAGGGGEGGGVARAGGARGGRVEQPNAHRRPPPVGPRGWVPPREDRGRGVGGCPPCAPRGPH